MERRPKYLLDTHTYLWWAMGGRALPSNVTSVIRDGKNDVWLSAASCWEMIIKHRQGKLVISSFMQVSIGDTAKALGFKLVNVSFAHAQRTGLLPMHHKDPFDRLLIAQALEEGFVLLSRDREFDPYGVERVWG